MRVIGALRKRYRFLQKRLHSIKKFVRFERAFNGHLGLSRVSGAFNGLHLHVLSRAFTGLRLDELLGLRLDIPWAPVLLLLQKFMLRIP